MTLTVSARTPDPAALFRQGLTHAEARSRLDSEGFNELPRAGRCFASLFTDCAISYRQAKGFNHISVALSIGVQQMVRSDLAGSGVMFSIDNEGGFPNVVVIDAAFGLGENVEQSAVDPDEHQVFKSLLARPAFAPLIRKKCGERAIEMIAGSAEAPTRNASTTKAERPTFVFSGDELLKLAA